MSPLASLIVGICLTLTSLASVVMTVVLQRSGERRDRRQALEMMSVGEIDAYWHEVTEQAMAEITTSMAKGRGWRTLVCWWKLRTWDKLVIEMEDEINRRTMR